MLAVCWLLQGRKDGSPGCKIQSLLHPGIPLINLKKLLGWMVLSPEVLGPSYLTRLDFSLKLGLPLDFHHTLWTTDLQLQVLSLKI